MARSGSYDAVGAFLDAVADEGDDSPHRIREGVLKWGTFIGDRYTLGERIARGGMATIWEADDAKLRRTVAIKFLGQAYSSDPEYRFRFEEEARAAAGLNSQYVVQTHDHGIHDDTPYIVMERLYGEDLHARLEREKRLPTRFLEKLAVEAGRALKVAHGAGIIHRDLKPKNLFIARSDEGETIKLLDFGVAKHSGTAAIMTESGIMLGSPYYMSPEQVRGDRNLDVRTDLWSFAAILYRAMTGVKAFDGDITAVMLAITRERPMRPSEVCGDIPPSVDAFFERALARDREHRFRSATEMVALFLAAIKDSSGVRRMSQPGLPAPVEVAKHDTSEGAVETAARPNERVVSPSEHPTAEVPVAEMGLMGQESALAPAPTGLRFARTTPDAPVDRLTVPNAWQADAPLTTEQQLGFSTTEDSSFESRWHREPAPSRGSLPQLVIDRKAYVVAGGFVIAAVFAIAFTLVLLLR